MERELKEGDRIIDWMGVHGTARNVLPMDEDRTFDLHGDDGEVYKNYLWAEGDYEGAFMFEAPDA